MSLKFQTLFTNPKNLPSFSYYCTGTRLFTPLKNPNPSLGNLPHFHIFSPNSPNCRIFTSKKTKLLPFKVFNSDNARALQTDVHAVNEFNVDAFLSAVEFFCLASSAIVSIGFAVNCMVSGTQKVVNVWLGNSVLVWQVVVLVVGVVIGAWIRRRQWRRICKENVKGGFENFVGRIEKLEEDLKSSVTIIRALSRQLEKLGIRFRVTRKALKEPIAQTAALAQKNSEATRALAMQEDILEKELREIQKVLLAMQEQQQKQLELILAIAKTGKLWENRSRPNQEEAAIEPHSSGNDGVVQKERTQVQTAARHHGTDND